MKKGLEGQSLPTQFSCNTAAEIKISLVGIKHTPCQRNKSAAIGVCK